MKRSEINTLVLGLEDGDEGKGKIVDLLAPAHDVIARGTGGPNTGHTSVSPEGIKLELSQVPSGIAHPGKLNIVGVGALVDPHKMLAEIATVKAQGLEVSPINLAVSNQAALILPHHILSDEIRERSSRSLGSTKSGIAFAAGGKYSKESPRTNLIYEDPEYLKYLVFKGLCEILHNTGRLTPYKLETEAKNWVSKSQALVPYLKDTVSLLHQRLDDGATLLAEGAQAFGLDIDHGTPPFTSSFHTTTGGVLNGLGVGPQTFKRIIGVVKATRSRVGDGPFVTEIDEEQEPELVGRLRGPLGAIDSEYGTVSGRPRRMGYPDLFRAKHAVRVNGVTEVALTKLDNLSDYGRAVLVAIGYKRGGKEIDSIPVTAAELSQCKPTYERLTIWKPEIDITGIRRYDDLPDEAKVIIKFFEDYLGVRIKLIGTGPARQEIIQLP